MTVSTERESRDLFHPGLFAAGLLSVLFAAHAAEAIDLGLISRYVGISLGSGAIYLIAVGIVIWRPPLRRDFALILLVALVLRGMALTPAPNLSTDAYRYVWDGRVQAAGFNPYLYVPADERLEHLRDQSIYPSINQKEHAVTIYPPTAELLFRIGHWIDDSLTGIRTVMALLDLVTIGALILLLGQLGWARERIIIYAWHPLPIWEFVSQSHIDAAATAGIALGLLAAVRGRQGLTGAIFAVSALIKYFPVVLLPALWRHFDWRLPTAFVATAVLFYLPYVGEAGRQVLGFLGSHLDNEGYRAGWGFHSIWLLRDFGLADPPVGLYLGAAFALFAGLALFTLMQRRADELRFDHLLLLGGAFVFLVSPHYPWYFGFLVALLVLAPRAWAFAMTLMAVVLQLPRPPGGVTWTELYFAVYWLPLALLLGSLMAGRGRRMGAPGARRITASASSR